MRRIIFFLIRICISAGVLLFLFKRVDLGKIIQVIPSANKTILIIALLTVFLCYIIGFLRWRMLLIGLGLDLAPSLIFRSYGLGLFSNLFFPSTVGGDILRGIDLGLRIQEPRRVAASIVLDRLSGYFAMVVVVLSALLLFGREIIIDKVVFLILGIILSLSVGFLAILFNNFLFSRVSKLLHFFGRTGEVLKNLHFEIYNFRNQKRIIIKNFAYSLIIQLMMPFSFYLISFALSARISPIYFFVLVPIIATISALPISIAGLGLREASSVYFFTKVGMSSEVALATPLLSFFIIFLFGLCGGIIYVITFSHRRVQRN